MNETLERNKRNAMAFYDLMFNQCKPREAIERYAGDTYIQHNPHVADGKQAFIVLSSSSREYDPSIGGDMYPWLWFWAPQVHFPWSGDVAQRIDPDTHWFFQGINPGAGDPRIEEKAFDIASYGRQLGLITEVLIDIAEQAKPKSSKAAASLERLKLIRDQIEQVKAVELGARAADLEAQLAELRRKGGAEYTQLAARLLPLLSAPAA